MAIPIEIGKRFGRLVVIADAGSKRIGKKGESKRIVKAKCDCGTICIKQFGLVRRGIVKSCGCIQREWISQHALNRRKAPGESALNGLYATYRWAAVKRSLNFSLTKEQFRQLTGSNCVYCGAEPSAIICPEDARGGYIYNGIDRVDNSVGYTTENSVTCCKTCNLAKRGMSVKEFEAWINRLVAYRQQQVVV